MAIRRVLFEECMLWCWLIDMELLGFFLGGMVMYLLRNHVISMEKSCGGGCTVFINGLFGFHMVFLFPFELF